ncbi:MAG: RidA family protein [Acidimicrobiales bacterium]
MRTNISSGDPFEEIFGYSRAVRVGNMIHVSGTTAQPPHVEGCDSYEQAVDALGIIGDALKEAGAGFESVVRTVTYVTDISDVDMVARAHLEVFKDVRPAATLVEVSALDHPSRTVEIEVDAIVE